MNPAEQAIENVLAVKRMDNELAREHILKYEEWARENLLIGKITQEEAWDIFFGLLHECDERQLMEDRKRIVRNIDTQRYNPFKSKDPQVRFLAMFRARAIGLLPQERN